MLGVTFVSGRLQRVVLNGEFSDWMEVLSGVPQGSVLAPLLFIIFINDLDLEAAAADLISKFADDTKVGVYVRGEGDRNRLQLVLNNLMAWADCWGMKFNVSKCKVVHFGSRNPKYSYTMNGAELEVSKEEKDLGVLVTDKLSVSAQCAKAARMANAVLGQISRAFHFRDRDIFTGLYSVQAICETPLGICCSGLVTVAGKGQGIARSSSDKSGLSQACVHRTTWDA